MPAWKPAGGSATGSALWSALGFFSYWRSFSGSFFFDMRRLAMNSDEGKKGKEMPEAVPPPLGTMFVLILFLSVLAGMWAYLYKEMVTR